MIPLITYQRRGKNSRNRHISMVNEGFEGASMAGTRDSTCSRIVRQKVRV